MTTLMSLNSYIYLQHSFVYHIVLFACVAIANAFVSYRTFHNLLLLYVYLYRSQNNTINFKKSKMWGGSGERLFMHMECGFTELLIYDITLHPEIIIPYCD